MKIDITGVDVVELVKKAFELSRPQGLGVFSANEKPLPDEEVKQLIRPDGTVRMDYVHGRACKFDVSKDEEGKFSIYAPWYDHTDEQLVELLAHVGISYDGKAEHSPSCNCDPCRQKQGKSPLNPITGM